MCQHRQWNGATYSVEVVQFGDAKPGRDMFADIRTGGKRRSVMMAIAVVFVCALSLISTAGTASAAESATGSACSAGWVALTYDDGPWAGRSEVLWEALDVADVHATFFTVGRMVNQFPEGIREEAERGHAVANHSHLHEDLTTLSEADVVTTLDAADAAIRTAGVDAVRLVRPGYGRTNASVTNIIERAGYGQILWTIDPRDWAGTSASEIHDNVVKHVHDGAVVVLHDGNANYKNTAAATISIVATLREKGYCFGVLDSSGSIVRTARSGSEPSNMVPNPTPDVLSAGVDGVVMGDSAMENPVQAAIVVGSELPAPFNCRLCLPLAMASVLTIVLMIGRSSRTRHARIQMSRSRRADI
jgi:peptidoglycan/xylan/chitin deacetylase (PgdA/CDA1 family)